MGAGLGGGSADASFAIRGVNELFGLGLDNAAMAQVALKVGADCPFFIYNRPALATGVGEILEPVDISVIAGCGLLIAKPRSEAVSTREAYAGVTIGAPVPGKSPASELTNAVGTWRHSPLMVNGFEDTIFPLRPEIRAVKERMYGAGAMFASMSGSGAAVYGIFPDAKMAEEARGGFGDCEVFAGVL